MLLKRYLLSWRTHCDQESVTSKPTAASSNAQFPICLFLAAITLLCFWPLSHHEFIVYDDYEYITQNHHVQTGLTWEGIRWAFGSIDSCNWHPLTWISHMADCTIYGLNAGGHHFTNLVFHVANTLLLFLLLSRITGARWPSAFVAALFAWHPLHVESVAWVAERKDVLSTFFFLSSLLAYATYVRARGLESKVKRPGPDEQNTEAKAQLTEDRPRIRSLGVYWLSVFLFALGLMSKPMVVTLPCVLLLLDFWPFQRFEISNFKFQIPNIRRLVLEKSPFFLLALAGSILTFLAQKAGGSVSSLTTIPLPLRISNAIMAYLQYLLKTFWPLDLSPFYPYQAHWPLALVVFGAVLIAAVTLASILSARRRPYLIFGWFCFLGTLVPAIGLVQVGSQSMADRYMYIPSIGLFVLLVWSVNDLCRALTVRLPVLVSAGTVALTACMILTSTQLRYWHDSVTLFQHALEVTPQNYVAYNYLGNAYGYLGQKDKALALCSESVRFSPHYVEGQYNLGTILLELGRTDEAAKCFSQAIDDEPNFVRAYNNLGQALLTQGHLAEAIDRFRQAIQLKPDWPEAHYNLGTALLTGGKAADAIAELSEAVRLKPRNPEAHKNLGVALACQGKAAPALNQFAEAVRLAPDDPDAHFNYGVALLEQKQPGEAVVQFADELRLRPEEPKAHYWMAVALVQLNQTEDAILHYCETLRLAPDFAQARDELACLTPGD